MYWFETSYRPTYVIRGSIETLGLMSEDMCVRDAVQRWEMCERHRKWWRKGLKVVRKESVIVQSVLDRFARPRSRWRAYSLLSITQTSPSAKSERVEQQGAHKRCVDRWLCRNHRGQHRCCCACTPGTQGKKRQ